MNYRKILLPVILILITLNASKAQYVLKEAMMQASLFNYVQAKTLYEKAYKKKPTIDAARGLAEAYRMTNDYEFAESWYTKVVAYPNHTPEDELYFAQMLMNNSKYNEAKNQLTSYLSKTTGDKRAANMRAGCDSALTWIAKPVNGRLSNLQEINSKYSDWGTTVYNNKIIFASDRPYDSLRSGPFFGSSNIKRKSYGWTGNSYLHLYESDGKDSSAVRLLNRGINGDFHSATASYSADGKSMFYAATVLEKKGRSFLGKDGPYTLNVEIRETDLDSATGRWRQPYAFPYNEVFNFSVGDPYIAANGQTLYFVADFGKRGMGGTDIYYSKRDAAGKWMEPVNMGPQINTEGDERTPFVDKSGNLYFASNGRAGMGGLDLFVAVSSDTNWVIKNLGVPVNSPQDDFAPYKEDEQTLLFSSNRLQGKGNDDIYRFEIARIPVFSLTGKVLDKKTNEPLANSVVTLFNNETSTPLKVVTDSEGDFSFKLDSASDYALSGVKTGYASITAIPLTTKGLHTSTNIEKDIYLDRAEVNKPVKLDNIYFDLDKWEIRADAAIELDKVVKLLNDNPTWKIEMSSHTDSRASDKYNLQLSQRRAESTVKYLESRGISAERLTAKGYGETRLVNKCANGVACSEEEHQLNRRTEFTILDK